MSDCLFCRIADKTLPAKIIYEDDVVLAFEDIAPCAPCHLLIIPKKHIASLNELSDADTPLAGTLIQTAKKLAQELGYSDDGYRIVMNCGQTAGQTVFHLHLHLLSGRLLQWPPG